MIKRTMTFPLLPGLELDADKVVTKRNTPFDYEIETNNVTFTDSRVSYIFTLDSGPSITISEKDAGTQHVAVCMITETIEPEAGKIYLVSEAESDDEYKWTVLCFESLTGSGLLFRDLPDSGDEKLPDEVGVNTREEIIIHKEFDINVKEYLS